MFEPHVRIGETDCGALNFIYFLRYDTIVLFLRRRMIYYEIEDEESDCSFAFLIDGAYWLCARAVFIKKVQRSSCLSTEPFSIFYFGV